MQLQVDFFRLKTSRKLEQKLIQAKICIGAIQDIKYAIT